MSVNYRGLTKSQKLKINKANKKKKKRETKKKQQQYFNGLIRSPRLLIRFC